MKWQYLIAAVLVASCGGPTDTGPNGPLDLGIVSGNDQTARASKEQLGAPVVGRLVRLPNGTVAFRWSDAILPAKAYAQTTVNGSPVAGAVVCAVSITADRPLTPFVPCTNTDTAGKATFFFQTGHTAGESRAEIRGTVDNQPAVFDTARATVLPDSAAGLRVRLADRDLGTKQVGDTIFIDREVSDVKDKYGNVITDWTAHWVFTSDSTVTGSSPTPELPNTGRIAVVPAGARTLWFKIDAVRVFLKLRTP